MFAGSLQTRKVSFKSMRIYAALLCFRYTVLSSLQDRSRFATDLHFFHLVDCYSAPSTLKHLVQTTPMEMMSTNCLSP